MNNLRWRGVGWWGGNRKPQFGQTLTRGDTSRYANLCEELSDHRERAISAWGLKGLVNTGGASTLGLKRILRRRDCKRTKKGVKTTPGPVERLEWSHLAIHTSSSGSAPPANTKTMAQSTGIDQRRRAKPSECAGVKALIHADIIWFLFIFCFLQPQFNKEWPKHF